MKIRTPSRIHITLIDLNGKIGRVDGGVGFALEKPSIRIKAKESDEVVVKGNWENLERFKEIAELFSDKFKRGIEIEVLESYPSHVGLGSGTQISLAVGKVYCKLYDIGMTEREIARFTGRGGTSGIGVAVFESGGFVLDGGHSIHEKASFIPSSFSKAKPAPLIARHDLPDWEVYLFLPKAKGFYGMREKDLFENNTPLPIEEVRELSHIILMKLLPSVVENNLDEFGDAIYRIQNLGFKRAEIMQYGNLISGFIEEMKDYGAVGMSSTGPALYFIGDSCGISVGKDYFRERGYELEVVKTKPRNRGAEIEV